MSEYHGDEDEIFWAALDEHDAKFEIDENGGKFELGEDEAIVAISDEIIETLKKRLGLKDK